MWPNPQKLPVWSNLLKKSLMVNSIYLCTMREASGNIFKQAVVEDYLEPYLISIIARFSEIGE